MFGPGFDSRRLHKNMNSIILIILAVLFVFLLFGAKKSQAGLNARRRKMVDKIKNREWD